MLRVFALSSILTVPLFSAEIPKGTHVLLKMINSVTTRTAVQGDQVYLQTATPVAIDGEIVVPPNAYVQGTVSLAKRGGRVKGRAELGLRLDSLTLPSGKVLKIQPRLATVDSGDSGQKIDQKGESTIQQGSDVGKDAKTVAITAGTGAAIGGISTTSIRGAGIGAATGVAVALVSGLFTRGSDVELKSGSTIDVVFDRDVHVD